MTFQQSNLRILAFIGKGIAAPYVMGDFVDALQELGHEVLCLDLPEAFEGMEAIKSSLYQIEEFNPDFAIFYGVSGVIYLDSGKTTHLLEQLGIPYCCLIYDNPWMFMNSLKESYSSLATLFVFDKTYLKELKEEGFNRTYYLPLASNPKHWMGKDAIDTEKFKCDVAFVGSMGKKIDTATIGDKRLGLIYDSALRLRCKMPHRSTYSVLKMMMEQTDDIQLKSKILNLLHTSTLTKITHLLDGDVSFINRGEIIRQLQESNLHVYGTETWLNVISRPEILKGTIDYINELPLLYKAAKINLNISSGQLITSVNQRVFDVPCAGGFLLTDYKSELREMFKIGQESVYYRDYNDLKEKINYYLQHPEERQAIAQAGQKRVLNEHTYLHRARELVQTLLELYGPNGFRGDGIVAATAVDAAYTKQISCALCGGNEQDPLYHYDVSLGGESYGFDLVKCKNCGLVYNNPQWLPEILFKKYGESYAKDRKNPIEDVFKINVPLNERLLDEIENYCSAGSLLDVGSGSGSFAAVAAARGWEVYCVEPREEAVEFSKNLFGLQNIQCGTLDNIKFAENTFDLITFNDVLEHTFDPADSLQKAYHYLKEGGFVVVNVPDAGSLYSRYSGKDWKHYDPPFHLFDFDRNTLKALFEKNGFNVVKMKTGIFYYGQILALAQKNSCMVVKDSEKPTGH